MIGGPRMYPHKNIRLSPSNYLGQRTYFVTQCCENRAEYFREAKNCDRLLSHLRSLSKTHHFAVLAYCIMPDHLHIMLDGLEPTSNLMAFMKSFKIKTSREFSRRASGLLWQKKYYDHILRPKESVDAVAWYIWMNPVRASLADTPGKYPYAGSFVTMIPKVPALPDMWVPSYKLKKRPPQKAAATKARS
jgi:putative transposase